MSATEVHAPSPRGLSRLRRNKANNQSTSSLVSTTSEEHSEGGLKASIGNVIDKVRKSIDDRRDSADGGVSPQRRLSAMFKKKNRRASQQLGDSNELSVVDSQSDLSAMTESRTSSLLTDEGPGDEG